MARLYDSNPLAIRDLLVEQPRWSGTSGAVGLHAPWPLSGIYGSRLARGPTLGATFEQCRWLLRHLQRGDGGRRLLNG